MKHEGTFTFLRTVTFSKKKARMSPGFTGAANVYAFEPADPKETKVRYAAVVTGVRHEVMCTAEKLQDRAGEQALIFYAR